MFEELTGLGEGDESGDLPPAPADPQARFGGYPGGAARAAVKAFTWIFGFPAGFALEITSPQAGEAGAQRAEGERRPVELGAAQAGADPAPGAAEAGRQP
jgi:hypothetical protein